MGVALKGVYAISDEELTPYDKLPHMLELAIRGGVSLFQLRDKTHSDTELLSLAQDLARLCAKNHVGFIINDRLELALKCHAFGLHLGQEDMPLKEARKRFKGVIGVSCYGDVKRAKEAQDLGADYVAFGACFASSTKPSARTISKEVFIQARAHLSLPLCAIGGLNPHNLATLPSLDLCAVISSLWLGDITQNARDLKEALRLKF
ncbi:thiamine phosphate synthase [Helicobacter ailurogastricus]|uniref:Thiamine-phosphate synthase n=1 Tax=Helicobacter ailurogastricus TaxID=1578720 RepID=A0A0K2Y1U0_9HELI|nr:thiamine phosphate synthase [Helicobacter ailurogastricus]BDQ29416.1 thiamine-phosphate synthase [Helicobacter ailurogastricus]CRF52292.1 Thiamin-phosphate pyrophosphorylase [Helicobacter ailurogastricus]